MKTITATIPAFITNPWDTPGSIQEREPDNAVGSLSYYTRPIEGWTQVGTAEITVTFFDDSKFLDKKSPRSRRQK